MNLFEQAHQDRLATTAPLAARMRPRTLAEYVGQGHIIGPGRLLRRAIEADQLGSLIFYGPPGTGKTTLAEVIANTTKAHFTKLNAVLAGVKNIREAVAEAQERAQLHGRRTLLFVDEVHRFNKAQQDALLPWVENGTVILIGATTENPYFEVNKALVSRSRIFQLQPLSQDDLRAIARQTLADPQRGYGKLNVTLADDALDHLVEVANGDARALLNALELAVETTLPKSEDQRLKIGNTKDSSDSQSSIFNLFISLDIAEESIQRRAVLYDKEGDYHFDTISAFIKSLRGSDPDAALYWAARMVYAGEDPRFIFRRLVIFASEDVGLADPQAVAVTVACAEAFERVGMPEGRFPLSQAILYLATAPKSNTTFAFFDAVATVEQETQHDLPSHLRDGSRDKEGFGHGEGYLYPHAYRDHWVAQQYLPPSMQGKVFYQPSDQGYERGIRDEVARRREAQLSAMLAAEAAGEVDGLGIEFLSNSPTNQAQERWIQRTVSQAGERLGALRDRVLDSARLTRHATVLDLRAASGLLTWEALRRVPEGGVTALAWSATDAEALRQQSEGLDEVERPTVLEADPSLALPMMGRGLLGGETLSSRNDELLVEQKMPSQSDQLIDKPPSSPRGEGTGEGVSLPTHFDAIVGYNALLPRADKAATAQSLRDHLAPSGLISLADRVPRHTQRLHALVNWGDAEPGLRERVVKAEEAIYDDADDPLVNWDADDLVAHFEQAGFAVEHETSDEASEVQISEATVARWFGAASGGKPSYAERLAAGLASEEIEAVRALFERQLVGQTVSWSGRLVYLTARLA